MKQTQTINKRFISFLLTDYLVSLSGCAPRVCPPLGGSIEPFSKDESDAHKRGGKKDLELFALKKVMLLLFYAKIRKESKRKEMWIKD